MEAGFNDDESDEDEVGETFGDLFFCGLELA